MTVMDIVIAGGGISTAVAGFFLRECYVMLKGNTKDISEVKEKVVDHEVRIKHLERENYA